MDFAAKLSTEGHACIGHIESYPVKIDWCHENPCKDNKGE
jgi:hypothetical protein